MLIRVLFTGSYDIVDNKKRNKIANLLKDYGERVQYSVFEANLTKNMLDRMRQEVLEYISHEEDSLRIYTLCEGCQKKVEVYGIGKVTEDEDVIVV